MSSSVVVGVTGMTGQQARDLLFRCSQFNATLVGIDQKRLGARLNSEFFGAKITRAHAVEQAPYHFSRRKTVFLAKSDATLGATFAFSWKFRRNF